MTTLDECLVSYFGQLKQALAQLATLSESANLLDLIESVRIEIIESSPMGTTTTATTGPNLIEMNEEIESLKNELTRRDVNLREMTEAHDQLKTSYEASVRLGEELKSRLEKLQTQYLELDEKRRSDERELNSLRESATASPTIEQSSQQSIEEAALSKLVVNNGENMNSQPTSTSGKLYFRIFFSKFLYL